MNNKENLITDDTINIQPKAAIYKTYERLSYKPIYALAEFVDNSTASYFNHKEELNEYYQKKFGKNFQLGIYILCYNENESSELIIIDNAYGMEQDEFKKALILGEKNEYIGGRNEFGMGLKTAATWFSKKWILESTKLGSQTAYSTTMDIEEIIRTNSNAIQLIKKPSTENVHGTTLHLKNLNKPIRTKKQKSDIARLLSGMYRRDIKKGEIKIFFAEYNRNKTWSDISGNIYQDMKDVPPIEFHEITPKIILPGQIQEINEPTKALTSLEDSFVFEGKTFNVKMTIGIRDVGSRNEAGFTLFRRNRAIVGGYEGNYRPREIFGDASSFAFQRIYGEIDLDDFPVNQAKDGFSWDDGLEEAFISFLIDKTSKFKRWAEKLRKFDNTEIKKISSKKIAEKDKKISSMLYGDYNVKTSTEINKDLDTEAATNELEELVLSEDNHQIQNNMSNIMTFEKDDINHSFSFRISTLKEPKEWIRISEINSKKGLYDIQLFVEHQFLKPLAQEKDFILFMNKFSVAYAAAILSLREKSPDKRVDPLKITKKINEYLLKNSQE